MKKYVVYRRALTLILAILLLIAGFGQPVVFAVPCNSVRLQDDFYEAVNADWLRETKLLPNQVSISGFCELSQKVHIQLLADFHGMNPDETPGALGQFLAYWAMARDFDTRNAQGIAPLTPIIRRILDLEVFADLDAEMDQWVLDSMALPFALHVAPDMGNARQHTLYLYGPGLFLPDVSYYGTALGETLLEAFAETGIALLTLAGITDAETVMADALAFDAMLLPYVKTASERSAYADLYHPMDVSAFASPDSGFDLGRLAQRLLGARPESLVVTNPQYAEAIPDLFRDVHFDLLKHWMLVRTVFDLAGFLDQDFLRVAETYNKALTGQPRARNPEDLAFALAMEVYSTVVGDYYGRSYFGEDARLEVSAMAEALTETFRARLLQNDWLSPETIRAALGKLDTLTIHIGYPDRVDPIYQDFLLTGAEEGGTLLGNTLAFARIAREENFARFGTEVDRSLWGIPAHVVNAQYNPLANAITFPAAILQAPFYSADQSMSANYGGIGAVIAHEITHAFDSNGAQFDADGNLHNWWTPADYAAFSEKTQEMVDLFDGILHGDGAVCGTLTVSENIADAGGLATALDVVNTLPDGDPEAFFRNWAILWRNIATPEYSSLLLALDVHAPGKLRTNVQLGNLDAFYDTFSVTEADGMHIPKTRRVVIW